MPITRTEIISYDCDHCGKHVDTLDETKTSARMMAEFVGGSTAYPQMETWLCVDCTPLLLDLLNIVHADPPADPTPDPIIPNTDDQGTPDD